MNKCLSPSNMEFLNGGQKDNRINRAPQVI